MLIGMMCGCLLALLVLRETIGDPIAIVEADSANYKQLLPPPLRRGLRALQAASGVVVEETKQVIVLYAGPIHLPNPNAEGYEVYSETYTRDKLRTRNFEFFLSTGIDCRVHDTVLVLGEQVAQSYGPRLDSMNQACRALGNFIKLVTRDEECERVEPMRLILHGGLVDLTLYDALIHVNCEMTGPAPSASSSWTREFTKHFNLGDKIHMVGLSHVCNGKHSHAQADVFALDKKGIETIRASDVVFDCRDIKGDNGEDRYDNLSAIVGRYEIGMSRKIMDTGYKIYSMRSDFTMDKASRDTCIGDDIWVTSHLKAIYGHIPSLDEVLFFKTSRYLPQDIKEQIGYNGEPEWEWK